MSLRRTKGVRGVQWKATAGCNTRPQGPGRVGCVSGTTRPKNAQSNAQGRRAQANSKLSCRRVIMHGLGARSADGMNRESLMVKSDGSTQEGSRLGGAP